MTNSLGNFLVDPNVFLPQAQSGKAQLIMDQFAAWSASLIKGANRSLGGGWEKHDTQGVNPSLEIYETRLLLGQAGALVSGTLANGVYPKQRKRVVCEIGSAGSPYTLTVTTPDTTAGFACAGTFIFDVAGQAVEFVWMDDLATPAWRAVVVTRAGGTANNVVVGTTVLTGRNLWRNYFLSITGTVHSTGTQGIPNGSSVGERALVSNSTAGVTGDITLQGITNVGVAAAGKVLGPFTAVAQFTEIEWDGTNWCVIAANAAGTQVIT